MKKSLQYVAYGLLGIFVLLLVVVGYVAATFNPNDYKSLIVKLVQEKKQLQSHIAELEKYAKHAVVCGYWSVGALDDCTCGLSQLLQPKQEKGEA